MKQRQYFLYSIGILAMILIDQFSKWMAIHFLKGQSNFLIIKGLLEFEYLENRGAAFGSFDGKRVLLVLLTLVLTSLIIYRLICLPADKKYRGMKICLMAIISGALGNLLDRVFRGYVVDFIYFVPINFPRFNIADSYIVVALCILMILLFIYYQEKDTEFLLSLKRKME